MTEIREIELQALRDFQQANCAKTSSDVQFIQFVERNEDLSAACVRFIDQLRKAAKLAVITSHLFAFEMLLKLRIAKASADPTSEINMFMSLLEDITKKLLKMEWTPTPKTLPQLSLFLSHSSFI